MALGCIGNGKTMNVWVANIFAANSLACAIAMTSLGALFLFLATRLDRGRSHAWMRLDWFTPALRKWKPGAVPSHSFIGRSIRKVTPDFFQSNRITKRRGMVRRVLRWMGISWLASPVRRLVQAACLVAFLYLFLFVCWPYHARPNSDARSSHGWSFAEMDQATGRFSLSRDEPADYNAAQGTKLFLFDQSQPDLVRGSLGQVEVLGLDSRRCDLAPAGDLSVELLDAFYIGSGPIAIYDRDPTAWPTHYADSLSAKEFVSAEVFLLIDPLVSLSTAVASRSWVWSLSSAFAILVICMLIPRGFCGYLCPLGTTIDLFDWAIAGRTKRFRVPDQGWWVHTKYYLLAGTMGCAVMGVLVSGFVAAIPVLTRAMLLVVDPVQNGSMRGWHLVPSMNGGQWLSIGLFLSILCLGFLRPRFWCKYVCPSGAVFSLGNLFRVTERKVESSCIHCNKCVEICPFDAIKPDFTTRTSDCTMCQSCGGVCPTHAIKFVERWNVVELKVLNDPPSGDTPIGRRGFMSLAGGSAAAVAGGVAVTTLTKTFGANLNDPNAFRPVRPPGSVPEKNFLEMCIRCGECFKVCPNNVLQPEGFQQGIEGLWTPMVNADWAGCESSCNACGQVCPTGAIRALPLIEKKAARMGLAIVDELTCLPMANQEACDLCVQECNAAGYHAIEFMRVHSQMDDQGRPMEDSGFLAPKVLVESCVGCGLCQTRCFAINVKERGVLQRSAIVIEAGTGKEDRLMTGSYVEAQLQRSGTLRESEVIERAPQYFVPKTSPSSTPSENVESSESPF